MSSAGTAEEKQVAARFEKRLQRDQGFRLNADGSDRDEVKALVKLRPRQQFFETRGLDVDIDETEIADGLPQKNRLSGFRLHQAKVQRGRSGELQRNRRRPASGTDVQRAPRVGSDVPRGDDRLDQEPIDRVVLTTRGQPKRREIDLCVPLREQRIVAIEPIDEVGCQLGARLFSAASDAIAKFPRVTQGSERFPLDEYRRRRQRPQQAWRRECGAPVPASRAAPG